MSPSNGLLDLGRLVDNFDPWHHIKGVLAVIAPMIPLSFARPASVKCWNRAVCLGSRMDDRGRTGNFERRHKPRGHSGLRRGSGQRIASGRLDLNSGGHHWRGGHIPKGYN